ncbi:MAG: DUF5063 domain-containing protein [Pseudomonadota bacterium]|nr:DUF5063 domain-containing protein [Pseudomonadota bacterium]
MLNPERVQFMQLVETARNYCNLIDRVQGRNDWLVPLIQILPRLHAEVVALNDQGEGSFPPEMADFDDRFALFSELRSWLGERDMYWLEYDQPADACSDDEHRTGSLADDLTDIYFELKRGLKLLDAAGPDEVAHLWESGFNYHWGQHLVDAERHLYALKINDQLM